MACGHNEIRKSKHDSSLGAGQQPEGDSHRPLIWKEIMPPVFEGLSLGYCGFLDYG